jgi:hypothetical protein
MKEKEVGDAENFKTKQSINASHVGWLEHAK